MQQINDLSARIAKHKEQIKASINRVIDSGWLVLGPEVKEFEQTFAAFLGAHFCISLANGTDAIELALKSMGIGRGDLVATAANAGSYTTTAILAIGAQPVYMDVDLNTHCVTLQETIKAIKAGATAIVVTHLYGLAAPEITSIAEYCAQKNVFLLEDCAQAHGAQINGKRVGTFGHTASFSFYPTKNLGALGDGGAVVTNDPKLAEKIRSLRQYGWRTKYEIDTPHARNSRLDEMQAAILLSFLPQLDEANARRRAIASCYSNLINHVDVITPSKGELDYVAHLYVVRCKKNRDKLSEHLHKLNIASAIHYPIPDYRQPIFSEQFANIHLQNTEQLMNEILTLPCYPEMRDEEVRYVIDAVNGWQQ